MLWKHIQPFDLTHNVKVAGQIQPSQPPKGRRYWAHGNVGPIPSFQGIPAADSHLTPSLPDFGLCSSHVFSGASNVFDSSGDAGVDARSIRVPTGSAARFTSPGNRKRRRAEF